MVGKPKPGVNRPRFSSPRALSGVTAGQPLGSGASELVYSPIDYIDPWNIVLVTN
jgi:hypothetical protein